MIRRWNCSFWNLSLDPKHEKLSEHWAWTGCSLCVFVYLWLNKTQLLFNHFTHLSMITWTMTRTCDNARWLRPTLLTKYNISFSANNIEYTAEGNCWNGIQGNGMLNTPHLVVWYLGFKLLHTKSLTLYRWLFSLALIDRPNLRELTQHVYTYFEMITIPGIQFIQNLVETRILFVWYLCCDIVVLVLWQCGTCVVTVVLVLW